MLKYLLSLSLILIAFNSIGAERAIMVLYVAPIKIDLKSTENYSKILTNTVRTELGKSSQYKLANPELEQATELAKNYNEACLSVEECARKEAKAMDADMVLISDVTSVEKQCRITMRLENIYSKEIIKSKSSRASCSITDLEEKMVELVYLIMKNEAIENTGKERPARITSDPPGAMIIINNEYRGNTPLELKIPIGHIRLQMEFEGTDRYAPILVNELIEDSQTLFTYNKVFAERNAFIALEINPGLSKVKIDDKEIPSNLYKHIPVEIRKEHTIIITSERHKTQIIKTPLLEPDQEHKLIINLAPKSCVFKLSTNPTGAEVFENGNKIGTTPFQTNLDPGDHELSIQKPFYFARNLNFYCAPSTSVQQAIILKRTLYTPGEQKRVDKAHAFKMASYIGFGVSATMAAMSYKKYNDFKKYDKEYLSATDPYQIDSLKEQRASSKTQFRNYAIGSVATAGISYLFFKLGKFPEDLKQRNLITLIPENNGVALAWQFGW